MKKAKQDPVTQSRADELQQLRDKAVRARREYEDFNTKYFLTYLQDHRLTAAGVTLVEANASLDEYAGTEEMRGLKRQQAVDSYEQDFHRREGLRRAVHDAERQVRELETAIAETVDEPSVRAELGEAIKRLSEKREAVTNLREGHSRARQRVTAAEAWVVDAKAAVDAAIEDRAKIFEAAIDQGFSVDRDGSVREVRAAASDADDNLKAAHHAAEALQIKLADGEIELSEIQEKVQLLSGQILSLGVPALLQSVTAARTVVLEQEKILQYLARSASQERRQEVETFLNQSWLNPSVWVPCERHPAVAPWLAARDALMTSADTPLPMSGA